MKTYELDFLEGALKEWKKLNSTGRDQFARKLAERLTTPHVQSARLSGMRDCYKIKLKSAGYRLIDQVEDDVLAVLVIAIGKREQSKVYERAAKRLR